MPPNRADAAALVAGLLTPLAFAPFNLFPLAALAPATLFIAWRGATPARAAWRGFLYGLGMFGVGVSWVYVSLHTFGNMIAPLAALAVLLFTAGLALYPAALGALQARFPAPSIGAHFALLLPAAWVLFEWVRGWFLSGFPWLALGYSQVDTPLAGYAPWFGVYGVSLAVAATAGVLAAGWFDRTRALRVWVPMLALVWLGAWGLGAIEWVRPAGEPIRVALVQANVPLVLKWNPDRRQAILDNYISLSERAAKVDLIIWPEAALPGYLEQFGPELIPRLHRLVDARGADLLFGMIERDADKRRYYNSVVGIGDTSGRYRKRHLVPFGEFLPLPALFEWLIRYLHIPMSSFSAGDLEQPLLSAAGHMLGISVCYEDAFGEEVMRALPAAALLVNMSEDAWFGNSLAPHQRIQMARVRALEAGRPMLRAANTGPSVVIDHRGVVRARSPQFEPHVLTTSAQPMRGATPYARLGNGPLMALLAALAIAAAAWGARSARRSFSRDA